jgi:hypothetical protein
MFTSAHRALVDVVGLTLWQTYKKLRNITMLFMGSHPLFRLGQITTFHGKIHYFYGKITIFHGKIHYFDWAIFKFATC